jgi:2-methylcitrate dehydratase PrpD
MTLETTSATRELAAYVSPLGYEDLPEEVVERTEELFLDWVASALAGRGARPVRAMESFAEAMGPSDGPSEILVSRRRTSPLFAALVNGASSHVVEQDDVHSGALFHPGTVVFPAALAAAQETGASGRDLIVAAAAGYEVGVRVGRFLGRSHYRFFHTTGTAGTLAAAAAVARLFGSDEETMANALGSAGTQAAGLWEFLRDAADSKQLHTAKAASDGLLSAYLARDGFTGARHILEGERGMGAGMSGEADASVLVEGLGERWTVLETSFKYHASCRHTHPAADALLEAIREHGLKAEEISHVRARVHRQAIEVLGSVAKPRTIHQSKFSMGFVLALIAVKGSAMIEDFTDEALADPRLLEFAEKVEMVHDPEAEANSAGLWPGIVEIGTTGGETITSRVEVAKGDPGNMLSREELTDKARRLVAFGGGVSEEQVEELIGCALSLSRQPAVGDLLPGTGA